MTLVVGEVGRIILPFSSQIDPRDLGRDFGRSLVGAHEEGSTVGSGVAAGSCLELVLELAKVDSGNHRALWTLAHPGCYRAKIREVEEMLTIASAVALKGCVILLPPALAILESECYLYL